MPDHPSKINWERENVIKLTLKVNRNQDPVLFDIFSSVSTGRGAVAKDLMRRGAVDYQKPEK